MAHMHTPPMVKGFLEQKIELVGGSLVLHVPDFTQFAVLAGAVLSCTLFSAIFF